MDEALGDEDDATVPLLALNSDTRQSEETDRDLEARQK